MLDESNFGALLEAKRVLLIACGDRSDAYTQDCFFANLSDLEVLFADRATFAELTPDKSPLLGANQARLPYVALFVPPATAEAVLHDPDIEDVEAALLRLLDSRPPDDADAPAEAPPDAETLRARIEAEPAEPAHRLALARLHFDEGEADAGHAVLDAALEVFPRSTDLLGMRAGELMASHQYEPAHEAWRALLAIDADDPWAWLGVARCQEETGGDGAEALARALALDASLREELADDPSFAELLEEP